MATCLCKPTVPGAHAPQPLCLKLLLLNVRSVNNKTNHIHDLIMDEHVDVAFITNLVGCRRGSVVISVMPTRFKIQQQPWLGGQEGGVAVVYRSDILLIRRLGQQSPEFERLHLVLSDRDRVGLLYLLLPSCLSASTIWGGFECDVGVLNSMSWVTSVPMPRLQPIKWLWTSWPPWQPWVCLN